MYVLGVNSGPHDGSAVLLRDGEILVMIEQERLSRQKRAIGESPAGAVHRCLDAAGITLQDVGAIAVGWDVPRLAAIEGQPFRVDRFARWLLEVPATTSPPVEKLRFVPHHVAHAASALWTSGVPRAAVIVVDGRGEDCATSIGVGDGNGITFFETWDVGHSLGHLYGFAAEWAGFTEWDAGKLMGLASYGRPGQPVPLTIDGAGYRVDGVGDGKQPPAYRYFQLRRSVWTAFRARNFPFTVGSRREPMAHAHFAASIQDGLEAAVLDLARRLRARSDADTLVLAGGVALNCTLNGVLHRAAVFPDIHVPPVPHDAGVGLGAALSVWRAAAGPAATPPGGRMRHAYWGPDVTDEDVGGVLAENGLDGTRLAEEDLVETVAERLAGGALVGWFHGRSEVGQRALGARSILCDPRDRGAVARLNAVKGREVWRPLAPSVLEDSVPTLFGRILPSSADFMLSAWPVAEQARSLIPAAVHVDGTARPQVVRWATNPRLCRLIEAFRRRTGVPALINTSFNLAGEPNVFSPQDAVSTFLRSDLDVLVLGDWLVADTGGDAPGTDDTDPAPAISFLPWEPELGSRA